MSEATEIDLATRLESIAMEWFRRETPERRDLMAAAGEIRGMRAELAALEEDRRGPDPGAIRKMMRSWPKVREALKP